MLELSTETFRLPRDWELLSVKSLKVQVSFSKVAAEQEPFTAKFMVPLSSGMLNLSEGVKVVFVWACELGQKYANTETMITTASPVRTGLL